MKYTWFFIVVLQIGTLVGSEAKQHDKPIERDVEFNLSYDQQKESKSTSEKVTIPEEKARRVQSFTEKKDIK